jgi:hypothetical protein
VETFTDPKKMVENPNYQDQRQKSLAGLSDDLIDAPIIELINDFNKLPYCFTLQSCQLQIPLTEWSTGSPIFAFVFRTVIWVDGCLRL